MEENEFEEGRESSRFLSLLKPVRDLADNFNIDLAHELAEYLNHIGADFDGASNIIDFSEAALLIQGSTCVYSKKVEHLYNLVYKALEAVKTKKRVDDGAEAPASASHREGGRNNNGPNNLDDDDEDDDETALEKFWGVERFLTAAPTAEIDLGEDEDFQPPSLETLRPPAMLLALEAQGMSHQNDGKDGEQSVYRLQQSFMHVSGGLMLDARDLHRYDRHLCLVQGSGSFPESADDDLRLLLEPWASSVDKADATPADETAGTAGQVAGDEAGRAGAPTIQLEISNDSHAGATDLDLVAALSQDAMTEGVTGEDTDMGSALDPVPDAVNVEMSEAPPGDGSEAQALDAVLGDGADVKEEDEPVPGLDDSASTTSMRPPGGAGKEGPNSRANNDDVDGLEDVIPDDLYSAHQPGDDAEEPDQARHEASRHSKQKKAAAAVDPLPYVDPFAPLDPHDPGGMPAKPLKVKKILSRRRLPIFNKQSIYAVACARSSSSALYAAAVRRKPVPDGEEGKGVGRQQEQGQHATLRKRGVEADGAVGAAAVAESRWPGAEIFGLKPIAWPLLLDGHKKAGEQGSDDADNNRPSSFNSDLYQNAAATADRSRHAAALFSIALNRVIPPYVPSSLSPFLTNFPNAPQPQLGGGALLGSSRQPHPALDLLDAFDKGHLRGHSSAQTRGPVGEVAQPSSMAWPFYQSATQHDTATSTGAAGRGTHATAGKSGSYLSNLIRPEFEYFASAMRRLLPSAAGGADQANCGSDPSRSKNAHAKKVELESEFGAGQGLIDWSDLRAAADLVREAEDQAAAADSHLLPVAADFGFGFLPVLTGAKLLMEAKSDPAASRGGAGAEASDRATLSAPTDEGTRRAADDGDEELRILSLAEGLEGQEVLVDRLTLANNVDADTATSSAGRQTGDGVNEGATVGGEENDDSDGVEMDEEEGAHLFDYAHDDAAFDVGHDDDDVDVYDVDDVDAAERRAGMGGAAEGEEPTYEELCRSHMETLLAAAAARQVQSKLAQRVGCWRRRIDPVLAMEERRDVFDMRKYGGRIVVAMTASIERRARRRRERAEKKRQKMLALMAAKGESDSALSLSEQPTLTAVEEVTVSFEDLVLGGLGLTFGELGCRFGNDEDMESNRMDQEGQANGNRAGYSADGSAVVDLAEEDEEDYQGEAGKYLSTAAAGSGNPNGGATGRDKRGGESFQERSRYEVPRIFAAMLQLVNSSNLSIEREEGSSPDAPFRLRLLKSSMYHDEMSNRLADKSAAALTSAPPLSLPPQPSFGGQPSQGGGRVLQGGIPSARRARGVEPHGLHALLDDGDASMGLQDGRRVGGTRDAPQSSQSPGSSRDSGAGPGTGRPNGASVKVTRAPAAAKSTKRVPKKARRKE